MLINFSVYFRDGKFLVPAVARTDAGYYLDQGPVAVVAGDDRHGLEMTLAEAIARGNPTVPAPSRANFPVPVVLEPAGVKSWPAFEKRSIGWTVEGDAQTGFDVLVTGRSASGAWEDAPEQTTRVPGTAAAVASAILGHLAQRGDVRK